MARLSKNTIEKILDHVPNENFSEILIIAAALDNLNRELKGNEEHIYKLYGSLLKRHITLLNEKNK